MSIDIDWNAITGGEDGTALSESIRKFVHDRFQQIQLPRFIKGVEVHGFDFGQIPPEIEVKDICDPLDDFYEDDEDEEDDDDSQDQGYGPEEPDGSRVVPETTEKPEHTRPDRHWPIRNALDDLAEAHQPNVGPSHQTYTRNVLEASKPHPTTQRPPRKETEEIGARFGTAPWAERLSHLSGLRSSTSTPGIPGGTSNLSYFHLPLSAGLSGTTTPLAAVAGAHFQHNWPESSHHKGYGLQGNSELHGRRPTAATSSARSSTPPSSADLSSRPGSRHLREVENTVGSKPSTHIAGRLDDMEGLTGHNLSEHSPVPPAQTRPERERCIRERKPEDIQVLAHVAYYGDIKLSLTAEILLDYPIESFVGIPLQLTITGLSFDGIAILAYIQRRAHFCFLSPEDAAGFIGPDALDENMDSRASQSKSDAAVEQPRASNRPLSKAGGLLEGIYVESEIGERGSGKQVLKNVGKVEKFILEQVRRIFEDECVYPSFWTFLL